MDGFESNEGVILISATNRPDVLDPGSAASGVLIDRPLVALPDIKGREQILRVHMKRTPVGPDVNPTVIAKERPDFPERIWRILSPRRCWQPSETKKKSICMIWRMPRTRFTWV